MLGGAAEAGRDSLGEQLCSQPPTRGQENLVGLLEPINTRVSDPRYFLDTPQQGRPPGLCPFPSLVVPVLFSISCPWTRLLPQRQPSYRKLGDLICNYKW